MYHKIELLTLNSSYLVSISFHFSVLYKLIIYLFILISCLKKT